MNEQTKVAISFSLIVGLGVAIIGYVCYIAQYPPYKPIKAPVEAVERQTTEIAVDIPQSPAQSEFEDLLCAIEWVESRGDPNAVGDNGKAIGAYQIWKIYVDDVNRIFKLYIRPMYQKGGLYTYEDRWDRDKSREMTAIVILHYGKGDIEFMARIHNGGPNGYKSQATKKYWLKIKNYLDNLQ